MSISQFAYQANKREFGALTSIDLEHVSVSQLLGRDYVFIDTQHVSLPTNNLSLFHPLLDNLVAQLELTEAHTVAVSVRESLTGMTEFTRHDLTWNKQKICNVESTSITQSEQYEFMDMIWRCSTPAVSAY